MPFLMTWKPDGWPYENIQRMLRTFNEEGSVTELWRISAFNQSKVGDDVWLLRQGKGGRGIFGVGKISGTPSLAEFDGDRKMMVPVTFTRLVDPEKSLLIKLGELTGILTLGQIGAQSSGITVDEGQSNALAALLPKDYRDREGIDWNEEEIEALVSTYFSMLTKEISGQAYDKTQYRRILMRKIGRSEGSIERKHQNVSAVLHKLAFPWIAGYKPLGHEQAALAKEVANQLPPLWRELDRAKPSKPDKAQSENDVFVSRPDGSGNREWSEPLEPIARRFDAAKRDAKNKALGEEGEEFAFAMEKLRLERLAPKLGKLEVDWVSKTKGDGLGYDIASYDDEGQQIFIEVKTTRGDIDTPFFISERERVVANRNGARYRLYRVFSFGKNPKIFIINAPLEQFLDLKPIAYRVSVISPS